MVEKGETGRRKKKGQNRCQLLKRMKGMSKPSPPSASFGGCRRHGQDAMAWSSALSPDQVGKHTWVLAALLGHMDLSACEKVTELGFVLKYSKLSIINQL